MAQVKRAFKVGDTEGGYLFNFVQDPECTRARTAISTLITDLIDASGNLARVTDEVLKATVDPSKALFQLFVSALSYRLLLVCVYASDTYPILNR